MDAKILIRKVIERSRENNKVLVHQEQGMRIQMPFSFLRLPTRMQLPQLLRELEQDMETVINVLKPGPLGIIEHKFSAAEVQKAKATVRRAVENWQRNSALERNGRSQKH